LAIKLSIAAAAVDWYPIVKIEYAMTTIEDIIAITYSKMVAK
jgi:hypothetical protein